MKANVGSADRIIRIILGVVIFVVGYSIGEQVSRSDASDTQQIPTINEYKPFKTESYPILLEVSEHGTSLTFVFRDQESKEIIDTLNVSNINISAPTYQIVHASTHDWLVVTRIEGSGTGYIKYVDDWYTLNDSYTPILALSYESTKHLVLLGDQYNTHVNTRIMELDRSLKIERTTKNCI